MSQDTLTKRQLRRRKDDARRERLNNPRPHEIEPGRGVPGDWNTALVERWVDRKARRAAERSGDRQS